MDSIDQHPRDAVASLAAGIDALACAAWWRCTSPEIADHVLTLERLAARFEAARLRLLTEADTRRVGMEAGATSTGEWFTHTTNSRREHAGARVALAAALNGPLAATGTALAAGELSGEHAQVIYRAMSKLPPDLPDLDRARAETFLIEQARLLDPRQLARLALALRLRLNPCGDDDLADDEDAAIARREVRLSQADDGTWLLSGTLDPIGGATLAAALDPLSAPRPAEGGVPDPRTAPQRRADALVQLADQHLAGHTGNSPSRPRLIVTFTPGTTSTASGTTASTAAGAGQARPHPGGEAPQHTGTSFFAPGFLPGGALVSSTTVAVLACDAEFVPIFLDPTGVPLDVGRTVYSFPEKLRSAIRHRDQHCTYTGCRRPPAGCDIHHLTPFSIGGTTSERKGALLCKYHHRWVHRHGYHGELHGTQVTWHPPDRADLHERPPP